MQRVSAAYKAEQNEYLRNESYIWVYLGVISKEAQANAKANGTFAPYSFEEDSTKSVNFEAYYATPEENFTRVDGSQYFIPRSGSFALYQGAVTQEILDSITYTFEPYTALNIKGLTIDFGDFYPTRFTVSNGSPSYTYTYENTTPGIWTCEDVFLDSSHITITPLEMVGGRQRLRILNIIFGLGLVFDNKSLISTSWKSSCSHISDVLPTKTFQFTISNLNKKFATDDPYSFVSFLQQQQEIEFDYGRRLDDDSIYTIKGGKMYLKSWTSDDMQAQFNSVGLLEYISGTYYKGKYYPEGRTYYDLAIDVLEDAGIEEYAVDDYLKTLTTHNPLPIEKHKNLLQLIANASRSILYETRDGKIAIHSSFVPEITGITSNGAENYCNLNTLVDETIMACDYATSEKDFTFADATHFFRPRDNRVGVVEAGYTSSMVAYSNGKFPLNPQLVFQWEAAWTFYGLRIQFFGVKPKKFKIHTYKYGVFTETIEVSDISLDTRVENEFYDVDKLIFEFTETNPYQKIHVAKVVFGSITDYNLDYTDMTQSPQATTTEYVKDVNVQFYEFAYGSEEKKVGTTKAVSGSNTVTFNKACHDYSLSFKDEGEGTLTITDSGAYFVEFTSSREAEVNINGTEFAITEKTYTNPLNEIGTDKTASNILLDNLEMAEDECLWLSEYFDNDIDYTITYRGEPALDPDDQIYTENKYVSKNLVRIVDTQIDTSTGMSMTCKLNARRVSYSTASLVDVAIVDVSELSV